MSDDIFAQARDAFLSDLPPGERDQFEPCPSVSKLLDDIKSTPNLSRSRRPLYKFFEKVKTFGDTLTPYFKIIEIFCAAHPEWANIALGALRLVLLLASHYVTFFEKLCDTIEKLGARLPRYQRMYDALSGQVKVVEPDLAKSLRSLYGHLFEFFRAVARVFSSSSGKIKRTPMIVADLFWQPFEFRFQSILGQIEFHQALVQEEMLHASNGELKSIILADKEKLSATHQRLNETLGKLKNDFNDHSKQIFQSSVIRWVDPPDYRAYLYQATSQKMPGTNGWILMNPKFQKWASHPTVPCFEDSLRPEASGASSSFLWISGNPGCGKTVLASTVVSDKMNLCESTDFPAEVCYHFYSQEDGYRNTSCSAFRSLAAQIFHHFNYLEKIYHIFEVAAKNMATEPRAIEQELVETISQCLPHLQNLYFVIDGMDECADSDPLIDHLLGWSKDHNLRVAVFSRPTVSRLHREVSPDFQIQLGRSFLDDDIAIYVQREVDVLLQRKMLQPSVDESQIVHHMVERAEGMFLWVRLMMSYLQSPVMTKKQRVAVMLEPVIKGMDGMDDLYSRIHLRINSLDSISRDHAERTFIWISYASMTPELLREALYPDGWDMDENESTSIFEQAIVVNCGGLIEKGVGGSFRYIHLTARIYAERGASRGSELRPLVPDSRSVSAVVATRCMGYLHKQIPARPLPLSDSPEVTRNQRVESLSARWPLLGFAARTWMTEIIHALRMPGPRKPTSSLQEMVDIGLQYMKSKLSMMVWIETMYLFYGTSGCCLPEYSSSDLASCIDGKHGRALSQLAQLMLELSEDLQNLDAQWGPTLERQPQQIWRDVTIFRQSQFLVSTSAGNTESLAPRLEQGHSDRLEDRQHFGTANVVEPVFSVSRASENGEETAILSIFPCEEFRKGWMASPNIQLLDDTLFSRPPDYDKILNAYTGWQAAYEVFRDEGHVSRSKILISTLLEPEDVRICLKQTLLRSATAVSLSWKCNFPITIAPDLSGFSVLNNIARIEPDWKTGRTYRIPLTCEQLPSFYPYFPTWSSDAQRTPLTCEQLPSFYPYSQTWSSDSQRTPLTCEHGRLLRYYPYSLTWSSDSQHIVLADWYSNMKIYSWTFSKQVKEVKTWCAEKPCTANTNSLTVQAQDIMFHPSRSILLFRIDNEIYVWFYLKLLLFEEVTSIVDYDYKRPWLNNPRTESSDPFIYRPMPRRFEFCDTLPHKAVIDHENDLKVDRVSFSECGGSLAIYYSGMTIPCLEPVRCLTVLVEGIEELGQKRRRGQETPSCDDNNEREDYAIKRQHKDTLTTRASDSMSSTQSATIPKNTSSSSITLCNETNTVASLQQDKRRNRLRLQFVDANRAKTQIAEPARSISILNLPGGLSLEGTTSSVSFKSIPSGAAAAQGGDQADRPPPAEDETRIAKVTITQDPQEVYMSGRPPASRHFPLIVRKDVRALGDLAGRGFFLPQGQQRESPDNESGDHTGRSLATTRDEMSFFRLA